MATYSYVKIVNAGKLNNEIICGGIAATLQAVNTNGSNVDIIFDVSLSSGDQATLDTIVSNHTTDFPSRYKHLQDRSGIMMPLYNYPTDVYNNTIYNNLIDLKKKYHDIPFYVIINPASGPGTLSDGNYTVAIKRLRGAGIKALGYIDTNYAASTLDAVQLDLQRWLWLYPEIDGIYFDRMTTDANSAHFDYYTTISDMVKNSGICLTVGGAGAVPDYTYFERSIDIILTYNNSSYPTESDLKGDVANGNASYNYQRRAGIVYNQSSLDWTNVPLLRKYLGYIYVTDGNTPNAFSSVSVHLEALLRYLTTGRAMQFDGTNYVNAISIDERVPTAAQTDNTISSSKAVKSYVDTKALSKMRGLFETNSILIPAYLYPSDVYNNATFNSLIDLKKKYHKVPMYVILNPSNGPGTVVDGNYTVAIKRLTGAGIHVLGYIYTSYAARAIATVKADVDGWLSLYPEVEGIFVDNQTSDNTQSNLDYFTELTAYCHYKKFWPVIGNSGTAVYAEEYDTVDAIVVHEGTSFPSEATLKGDWAAGNASLNYNRRGVLVYNQASFDWANFQLVTKYCGFVYISNINGWTDISSYVRQMLGLLSNNNIEATVNTTNATVTTLETINTVTDSTLLLEAYVQARRTGGTGGAANDSASYIRRVKVKNSGGTVTLGTIQDGLTSEDQAGWDCTWAVSGTSVLLRVTGAANNNVTWNSRVYLMSNP
jgi:hypothetical protein